MDVGTIVIIGIAVIAMVAMHRAHGGGGHGGGGCGHGHDHGEDGERQIPPDPTSTPAKVPTHEHARDVPARGHSDH